MNEMYMNCKNAEKNELARMVVLISEKRCDDYTHSQEDVFTMRLERPF
jgi:hypothetical protein